jgi:hypothetical protein
MKRPNTARLLELGDRGRESTRPHPFEVPRCLECGHRIVTLGDAVHCSGCPRGFEMHGSVRVVLSGGAT